MANKNKKKEEVVLTKADFEQAVEDLGKFLGEKLVVEGERDECVEEFLNIVGGISDVDAKKLPDSVFTVNNVLVDKGADILVWEGESAEAEVEQGEIPEPEPKKVLKKTPTKKEIPKVMGKEKAPKEKPKGEKKVVAKVVKEKVAKTPKVKAEVGRGRYGHRKGSCADFMDELLWKGCSLNEAVTSISKSLNKTKERAKGMFLAHVYYLPDKKNIPIDKPKADGGKYKAKKDETDV